MARAQYSVSPSGEKFKIPAESDYKAELARLKKVVAMERRAGKEIVVWSASASSAR